MSNTSDWRFLRVSHVVLLLDGTRRLRFPVHHEGDVRRYGVTENIVAFISTADVRRLASARTVEGQLGSMTFALPPNFQEGVRKLLENVPSDWRWVPPR